MTVDDYDMFRTHHDNLTILSQTRDVKLSTPRSIMLPTVPFNSITMHDYNVLATSSTLLKRKIHRSDSDSDISEDCASLILESTDLCIKLSLNVKPAVLNRKSTNDGSNSPLLSNADQSSEIMGSISNQSTRFSGSKTSENEINNNCYTSLVNSNTTVHRPKQDRNVASCALLGLIRNSNNLDNKLKYCFPRGGNKKYDSDYHGGTCRYNQLHHADDNFNICRNKNAQ